MDADDSLVSNLESSILYDILVFKEWTSETETTSSKLLAESQGSWSESLRSYLFRSNPGSGSQDVDRFVSLLRRSLGWRLCVTEDSSRVALAMEDRIEILGQSQQTYLPIAVIKVSLLLSCLQNQINVRPITDRKG